MANRLFRKSAERGTLCNFCWISFTTLRSVLSNSSLRSSTFLRHCFVPGRDGDVFRGSDRYEGDRHCHARSRPQPPQPEPTRPLCPRTQRRSISAALGGRIGSGLPSR